MSGIYVHTRGEEPLTVQGTERHYAASTAVEATLEVLGANTPGGMLALTQGRLLPGDALAYASLGKNPRDGLRTWLADILGMSEVVINGEHAPVGHTTLNTAAVAGPDSVAFLARLYGSVEDRMWIAAEDTSWLGGVLQQGLDTAILRTNMGWEPVVDRLHATASPVVFSTSVGRPFPDFEYDTETDEYIEPDDPEALWDRSLEAVKEQGWWVQLTRENLRDPAYTPLVTFQDLLNSKGRGQA